MYINNNNSGSYSQQNSIGGLKDRLPSVLSCTGFKHAEYSKPTDEIVQFTEFIKDYGILTKKISIDSQLNVKKDASQCCMASGTAKIVRLKFSEFPDFIKSCGLNQAIGHGVCGFEEIKILSTAKFNNQPETIPRTKEYFHYPEGPALAMIDYDPDDGQPVRDYQEVIRIIDSVCPGFAATPKVLTYSTSSHIYFNNTELVGKGTGFHLYFLVKNGKDLGRFADVLFHRLWLAGYGHIKISRSGALLPRTIFDTAVFSPERLDFVAGANLMSSNITQRRPNPLYIPGGI